MATEPTAQILIAAKFERLRDLALWVEQLAAEFQLPLALAHRMDVCLTELVTNVISYGYPDGRVGAIKIRFWREPERIVVRIDDDATAFDPTSYQLSELPDSLDDARIGGRGIRLVRHFADELHYQAQTKGNQATLVFHAAAVGAQTAPAEGGGILS
jgi:serine/threonine-protein kinase RsbW